MVQHPPCQFPHHGSDAAGKGTTLSFRSAHKVRLFFDISHKTHKVFRIHAHKKAILNILWDKYFFIPLFFHTFVH